MPTIEKEINCNLYDQLTILERIERAMARGGIKTAEEEMEYIKKEINRKLYTL